jgi:hypothetical protein
MSEQESPIWIEIDPSKYDEDQAVEQSGVEFHVFISPYDMPEAVRGDYEPLKDRFVITFKYLGQEALKSEALDEEVTLYIGEKSNRLYRIETDVKRLGVNAVVLKVSRAFDQLLSRLDRKHAPRDNFRIAKSVIADNQKKLLAGLAS